MSCSRNPDPEDPSFDILILRVPAGTVECANQLAAQLILQKEAQTREQLLLDLRNAPISILMEAKQKLPEPEKEN